VFKCTNEATDQSNRRQGTHSARVGKTGEKGRDEGRRQHLLLSSYAPMWPFLIVVPSTSRTVEINFRANRAVVTIGVHARVAAHVLRHGVDRGIFAGSRSFLITCAWSSQAEFFISIRSRFRISIRHAWY